MFRLDRDVHELKFPGFGGRIPTASAVNVPDGGNAAPMPIG